MGGPDMAAEGFTRIAWEIEQLQPGFTKVTAIHDLEGAPQIAALVSGELETGRRRRLARGAQRPEDRPGDGRVPPRGLTVRRSGRLGGAASRRRPVCRCVSGMFWFSRNKLSGSYRFLMARAVPRRAGIRGADPLDALVFQEVHVRALVALSEVVRERLDPFLVLRAILDLFEQRRDVHHDLARPMRERGRVRGHACHRAAEHPELSCRHHRVRGLDPL